MIDLRNLFDISGLEDIDLKDNSKWVAIIGSRKASDDELETAYRFGRACAKKGKIVVSGLALGIDQAGHSGCLDAGGITIAIVNTPKFMPIYPKENQGLAERIKKQGCIVHPFKTKPKYEKSGFSQFQKRLIERSILNAYVCPNIVVVKNDDTLITGGTKWATYYGINIGHNVYRLDNSHKWYKNPKVEKCQVFWVREVDARIVLDDENV